MILLLLFLLLLQRKDFPSNSFYVVVVVKTEDQACGGSLPFYPFVEGKFRVLARDGSGPVASQKIEGTVWLLVDPLGLPKAWFHQP